MVFCLDMIQESSPVLLFLYVRWVFCLCYLAFVVLSCLLLAFSVPWDSGKKKARHLALIHRCFTKVEPFEVRNSGLSVIGREPGYMNFQPYLFVKNLLTSLICKAMYSNWLTYAPLSYKSFHSRVFANLICHYSHYSSTHSHGELDFVMFVFVTQ